jgi:hypothetical protein
MQLRVVPCRAMVKASVPQAPWGMPWFVAPQGISEGDRMFKVIDFYTLSVAQGYFCDTYMQELRIRLIPHQRSLITSHDTYCCMY